MNNKNIYFEKKQLKIAVILFILFGIVIRLFHFFYNRSLWMDEIYLATSLVKMNYKELVSHPLFYQQKAPIGFLLSVKFFVNLLGNKEINLRIVPLISGILSLFIFIPVGKYFLKPYAFLLALGILCLSPALIYHSVEIKQYSTELLGSVLSFYLYIKYKEDQKLVSLFLWGLFGALILWFSYSSIFILAGIGFALSITNIIQKKWNTFFLNIIPFSIWLISFVLNFFLFTHKHAESAWIAYWFRAYNNFMPFPPKSIADLKWFAMNIYRMLDYPLGLLWNFNGFSNNQNINMLLKMPFLPIIFLFAGIYIIIKRYRYESLVLLLPIILMFLASGLELYPLTERFWVFISPVFIIFIALGFDFFITKFNSNSVKYIVFVLLIIGPVEQAFSSVLQPQYFYIHKKSFQREALQFVNKNYKQGDAVYMYWNNLPGYKLYKEMYKFNFMAIEGTDQRKNSNNFEEYYLNLGTDFNKFSNNNRIWLVYNKYFLTDIGDKIDDPVWYYKKDLSPTKHLLNEFLKSYRIIKKIETKDITVCLLERKIKD